VAKKKIPAPDKDGSPAIQVVSSQSTEYAFDCFEMSSRCHGTVHTDLCPQARCCAECGYKSVCFLFVRVISVIRHLSITSIYRQLFSYRHGANLELS
jgi:hypothetical protein